MSEEIRIKKGLTINLTGEAEKTVTEINPKYCAIKPADSIFNPEGMVEKRACTQPGNQIN